MELLKERIRKDGKVKGTDVLKVDSFLNHQMDVELFAEIGKEFKRRFADCDVNKILTIEASGIGIACITAQFFHCPVIFAKKNQTKNIAGEVYTSQVESFTHGRVYNIIVAKEFDNLIPSFDTCEHVDRREGYFHITNFDGTVPLTKMKYLVRDFDMDGFNNRKEFLRRIGDYLNGVYGEGTVEVEFKDTYFSMYEAIKSNPAITEHALKAITDAGVTPRVEAVRGGTDGSVLSGRGLPCPNISAGYQSGHSIYEYITVQALETTANAIINLAVSFVE